MPNHCHNGVTVYSANTHDVAKIKQIFEDESCFGQIIPEPDWPNTPLTQQDSSNWLHPKRGEVGELPVKSEEPFVTYRFASTDKSDDRWYDWRLANWDTKWDAYDVVVTDDDPECTEIEFNTAWPCTMRGVHTTLSQDSYLSGRDTSSYTYLRQHL